MNKLLVCSLVVLLGLLSVSANVCVGPQWTAQTLASQFRPGFAETLSTLYLRADLQLFREDIYNVQGALDTVAILNYKDGVLYLINPASGNCTIQKTDIVPRSCIPVDFDYSYTYYLVGSLAVDVYHYQETAYTSHEVHVTAGSNILITESTSVFQADEFVHLFTVAFFNWNNTVVPASVFTPPSSCNGTSISESNIKLNTFGSLFSLFF